jgi:hypothetical protein
MLFPLGLTRSILSPNLWRDKPLAAAWPAGAGDTARTVRATHRHDLDVA